MENSPCQMKCAKKGWIFTFLFFSLFLNLSLAEARRIHLTPEQKSQLTKANSVFVRVIALTEKGPSDSTPFLKTITTRLQELNYTVITDPAQPHDIEFKVKCEERKTLTGTTATGGDVDLVDAPDQTLEGTGLSLNLSTRSSRLRLEEGNSHFIS